ncbi:hypothetical protein NE237_025532 [Protea cynaroides]|uniref:APO domain-containing protein n=1 Tax=Protea cynaroides TaxID=273540 RepID=A0A9Q0H4E6_9MAGN|nr:hypothetical protein NE237_025532 [Protea cynaroides]
MVLDASVLSCLGQGCPNNLSLYGLCFCSLKLYPNLSWIGSSKNFSISLFPLCMYGSNGHKLQIMFRSPTLKCISNFFQFVDHQKQLSQNADFPPYYSKKEKKAFPIPIVELRRAARERKKSRMGEPRRPVPPPRNVLNARVTLITNLKKLLNGLHEWTNATVHDVLLPIEAYHLFDRLGKCITCQERLSIPWIPAVWRKPVIRFSRSEIIDADESEFPDPCWGETMRQGALKLMKKYSVRVCGYCPEVHVGASGHKAQNSAVLDNLIPPRYMWHVPDVNGPLLQLELRSFYGQAPAVVEICVQGGAAVPEQYQPTMRLNIGIRSNVQEAERVV